MIWLEMLTLTDGSRVESAMPTSEEAATGLPAQTYRIRRPDGTTTHFSSMTETLQHLRRRFDPEELGAVTRAASAQTLGATLEPPRGVPTARDRPRF